MSNATVIKDQQNQFTVVEGEKRTIPITFIMSNKDYKTLDITGNTEVTARFIGSNSSFFELTKTGGDITVVNDAGGSIEITLSETNSAALMIGDRQSFEVSVNLANGDLRIAQILNRLNVKARISC